MIKVAIIGGTGYVGIELVRILAAHPQVEIVCIGSQTYAGQPLTQPYPHLSIGLDCVSIQEAIATPCDLLFMALPHGSAHPLLSSIQGKKVIDLSADFRFTAVYGLPEMGKREEIKAASLIANPGCYPTSIALGAMPALAQGIIKTEGIILDAKSGLSGAGRAPSLTSHFCEVAENFQAYQVGGTHRHIPEIEKILGEIAKTPLTVEFTPHLLPLVRGLLTTAYFSLQNPSAEEEIWQIYADAYRHEPFVRLCPLGSFPSTAAVRGSNYCDIGIKVNPRTQKLLVISAFDNLIKGAAGQAVQNMNILFNLPETQGLIQCPTYP